MRRSERAEPTGSATSDARRAQKVVGSSGGRAATARPEVLELQRRAGNRAVQGLLQRANQPATGSTPIQRDLDELYDQDRQTVLTTVPPMSQADGRGRLRRLAAGDAVALEGLVMRGMPMELGELEQAVATRSREFGLAAEDQADRVAIVVGGAGGVDWTLLEDVDGVAPLAHSHPHEGRRLQARFPLAEIFDQDGQTQSLVLPSMSDFWESHHTVYTPYRLLEGALVAEADDRPAPESTLAFQIHIDDAARTPDGAQVPGRQIEATLTALPSAEVPAPTWSQKVYVLEPDNPGAASNWARLPPSVEPIPAARPRDELEEALAAAREGVDEDEDAGEDDPSTNVELTEDELRGWFGN